MASAVEKARVRRLQVAVEKEARIEWFINDVLSRVNVSVKARVKLATNLVKTKVVKNISRPVTKIKGPRRRVAKGQAGGGQFKAGRIAVSGRSKPGEFPKADTTQLMKTIFGEVREVSPGVFDGFVGTPLDYGLILEIQLDRSFLVRTFNEERSKIIRIITGPGSDL